MTRPYEAILDEAVREERIAALRREDRLIGQIERLINENRILRSMLTKPPIRSGANPGQLPTPPGAGADVSTT